MNAIEDFLVHKERFANVHVHDNMGERDQHLPVGDGNIDFKQVLKQLSGYDGRYVIEARSLNEAVVSRDRLQHIFSSLG